MGDTNPDFDFIKSILERIDQLTSLLIEIKGDVVKRSEWQSDQARIYDNIEHVQNLLNQSFREAIGALTREVAEMEKNVVPRAEQEARWTAEDKRDRIIDARLTVVEKRAIPLPIITAASAGVGSFGLWLIQTLLHWYFSVNPTLHSVSIH